MSVLLRRYEASECGADGYPLAWHRCPECGGVGRTSGPGDVAILDASTMRVLTVVCPACEGAGSIKQMVRVRAGERCARCCHPFRVGVSGVYELQGGVPPRRGWADLDALWEDEVVAAEGRRRGVLWSACDERCTHGGPVRLRTPPDGVWHEIDGDLSSAPDGGYLYLLNGDEVQAPWRILTVHHLTGEKADCRPFNLCPLCQRCHLVMQRRVVLGRVYPFEHSEWFRPWAAAWYAQAYLGETIELDEASRRMGELLALERLA